MEVSTNVYFSTKFKAIKPLNEEMTLCRCYVLALGKNRAYSYIDREAADDALGTLFNVPIVGHVYVSEDGSYHMGGHDFVVQKDKDNKYKLKRITVPYGVVPLQDNVHYEDIIDSNGETKTYLVADVILWTGRYPEVKEAVYSDDIYYGQSMEIKILSYERLGDTAEDKKYSKIKKYRYSALCLLGKSDNEKENREPVFEDARIEPYQFSLCDDDWFSLMDNFKKELEECLKKTKMKGENKMTNELRDSILAEFGKSLSDIKFEITEDMSEDVLRTLLESEKPIENHGTAEIDGEPVEDGVNNTNTDNSTDFSYTYREKNEKLYSIVRALACGGADGKLCQIDYWLEDFDDRYVYMRISDYRSNEYKSSYGRLEYGSTDGGATYYLVGNKPEPMVSEWLTIDERDKIRRERDEYAALVEYKNQRITEDRKYEYEKVINEFSELSGNEEYQNVINNAAEFSSADELREKCFAIKGKIYSAIQKQKPQINKVPLERKEANENNVYEKFFRRYLPTQSE